MAIDQAQVETLIANFQERQQRLEQHEEEARNRLALVECYMPSILAWNVWRALEAKQLQTRAQKLESENNRLCDRVELLDNEKKKAQDSSGIARTPDDEAISLSVETCRDRIKEGGSPVVRADVGRIGQNAGMATVLLKPDAVNNVANEISNQPMSPSHVGLFATENELSLLPATSALSESASPEEFERIKQLQQMALNEMEMKKRIEQMERRENVYMEALQRAEELCTLVSIPSEDDMIVALQILIPQLEAENRRLRDLEFTLEGQLKRLNVPIPQKIQEIQDDSSKYKADVVQAAPAPSPVADEGPTQEETPTEFIQMAQETAEMASKAAEEAAKIDGTPELADEAAAIARQAKELAAKAADLAVPMEPVPVLEGEPVTTEDQVVEEVSDRVEDTGEVGQLDDTGGSGQPEDSGLGMEPGDTGETPQQDVTEESPQPEDTGGTVQQPEEEIFQSAVSTSQPRSQQMSREQSGARQTILVQLAEETADIASKTARKAAKMPETADLADNAAEIAEQARVLADKIAELGLAEGAAPDDDEHSVHYEPVCIEDQVVEEDYSDENLEGEETEQPETTGEEETAVPKEPSDEPPDQGDAAEPDAAEGQGGDEVVVEEEAAEVPEGGDVTEEIEAPDEVVEGAEPVAPEEGEVIEEPEAPEECEVIAEPEAPEECEVIAEPEAPEECEVIEEPEAPEECEVIEEPEAPEECEVIEEPEAPEECEVIAEPEAPEECEVIAEPEAPEECEVIAEPEAPEECEVIAEPEAPEECEVTEEPEAAEEPQEVEVIEEPEVEVFEENVEVAEEPVAAEVSEDVEETTPAPEVDFESLGELTKMAQETADMATKTAEMASKTAEEARAAEFAPGVRVATEIARLATELAKRATSLECVITTGGGVGLEGSPWPTEERGASGQVALVHMAQETAEMASKTAEEASKMADTAEVADNAAEIAKIALDLATKAADLSSSAKAIGESAEDEGSIHFEPIVVEDQVVEEDYSESEFTDEIFNEIPAEEDAGEAFEETIEPPDVEFVEAPAESEAPGEEMVDAPAESDEAPGEEMVEIPAEGAAEEGPGDETAPVEEVTEEGEPTLAEMAALTASAASETAYEAAKMAEVLQDQATPETADVVVDAISLASEAADIAKQAAELAERAAERAEDAEMHPEIICQCSEPISDDEEMEKILVEPVFQEAAAAPVIGEEAKQGLADGGEDIPPLPQFPPIPKDLSPIDELAEISKRLHIVFDHIQKCPACREAVGDSVDAFVLKLDSMTAVLTGICPAAAGPSEGPVGPVVCVPTEGPPPAEEPAGAPDVPIPSEEQPATEEPSAVPDVSAPSEEQPAAEEPPAAPDESAPSEGPQAAEEPAAAPDVGPAEEPVSFCFDDTPFQMPDPDDSFLIFETTYSRTTAEDFNFGPIGSCVLEPAKPFGFTDSQLALAFEEEVIEPVELGSHEQLFQDMFPDIVAAIQICPTIPEAAETTEGEPAVAEITEGEPVPAETTEEEPIAAEPGEEVARVTELTEGEPVTVEPFKPETQVPAIPDAVQQFPEYAVTSDSNLPDLILAMSKMASKTAEEAEKLKQIAAAEPGVLDAALVQEVADEAAAIARKAAELEQRMRELDITAMPIGPPQVTLSFLGGEPIQIPGPEDSFLAFESTYSRTTAEDFNFGATGSCVLEPAKPFGFTDSQLAVAFEEEVIEPVELGSHEELFQNVFPGIVATIAAQEEARLAELQQQQCDDGTAPTAGPESVSEPAEETPAEIEVTEEAAEPAEIPEAGPEEAAEPSEVPEAGPEEAAEPTEEPAEVPEAGPEEAAEPTEEPAEVPEAGPEEAAEPTEEPAEVLETGPEEAAEPTEEPAEVLEAGPEEAAEPTEEAPAETEVTEAEPEEAGEPTEEPAEVPEVGPEEAAEPTEEEPAEAEVTEAEPEVAVEPTEEAAEVPEAGPEEAAEPTEEPAEAEVTEAEPEEAAEPTEEPPAPEVTEAEPEEAAEPTEEPPAPEVTEAGPEEAAEPTEEAPVDTEVTEAEQEEPSQPVEEVLPVEEFGPEDTGISAAPGEVVEQIVDFGEAPVSQPPAREPQPILEKVTEDEALNDLLVSLQKRALSKSNEILEIKQLLGDLDRQQKSLMATLGQAGPSTGRPMPTSTMPTPDIGEGSGMIATIAALQEKCRLKDHLIGVMVDELRTRTQSGVWENLMTNIAAPGSPQPDFTRSDVSERLRTGQDKPPVPKLPCDCSNQRKATQECPGAPNIPTFPQGGPTIGVPMSPQQVDAQCVCPTDFRIIRQIGFDSLLLSWKACATPAVVGYEIYVNGLLAHKVRSNTRDRALLQCLDMSVDLDIKLFARLNTGQLSGGAQITYSVQR